MLDVVEKRSLGMAGFRLARDVIAFIETHLRFTNGKPFVLFPWQKRWILEVFREHEVVIEDSETGERVVERRRIIGNSLMTIPRKNGKTGLMAAIACAMAFGPLWERGVEIVCAATKKDQAKILFREVKKMMMASPVFAMDGTWNYHAESIFSEQHGVSFKPVASAEAGIHGENCNFVLLDEVARMRDLKVYDTLNEAVSTRPNSLVVCFSTMDERVDNPMTELIGNVRAREMAGIDASDWHVLEHRANLDADKGGNPDPLDWDNILDANPSAPHIPELMETLRRERRVAAGSDKALGRWITTRLNIAGSSETQLVDPLKWRDCAHPEGRAHLDSFDVGEEVCVGVDLSRSRDLTAVGLWWPERRFLDCMCFLPTNEIVTYEAKHKLPFRQWVEQGHVVAAEGRVVDYGVVAGFLKRIYDRFDVAVVRRDAWGAKIFDNALDKAGAGFECEDIRMGAFTLNNFMIHIENLVDAGLLQHSNSPILNYCVHSTAAVEDKRSVTGVRRPEKAYSTSLIDGAIAAMLALGPDDDTGRISLGDLLEV